ncbi:MAG: hypothetical protein ACE5JX_08360 [Acidobacteriota bacterium]
MNQRTEPKNPPGDPDPTGSRIGLGRGSNGEIIACAYAEDDNTEPNLVVYKYTGIDPFYFQVKWSKTDLASNAWASAPIVSTQGEVIAAESTGIRRYDTNGVVLTAEGWGGGPHRTCPGGSQVWQLEDGETSHFSPHRACPGGGPV